MSPNAEKLYNEAMQLPDDERADLAGKLIASLDLEVDDDADEAWAAEIARRVAEIENGTAKTIPWEEARRIIFGGNDGPSG
jgi:putative addiction module component (TIGR02574 family)